MMEWLEQHSGKSGEPETGEVIAVTFHETMTADHIVPVRGSMSSLHTTFAVSEMSGSIGISSLQANPSVSTIFPGTEKPAQFLTKDKKYTSSLFLTISDEEFLAAASEDRIQIFSLARNTSGEAYRFEESGFWHLCMIDERTVACVEESRPSDGFTKIYLLNTDSEKFHLSSILRVKAGRGITDICLVKTTNSTPCLLLTFPSDNFIQSVEMIGGKVKWQSAGSRHPWSICTDGRTVFVLDPAMNNLRLLSVEDGSVLTSITLYPFDMNLPSSVRLQGDYLHIGHMNKKGDTFCISKFTKKF